MQRRHFLQTLAQLGASAGVASAATPPPAQALPRSPKRVLRAAHLTDIHVQSGLGAPAGMAAALRHAQGLADKPDLLLFGGDCIGDALETPKDEVLRQWEVWDRVCAAELRLPARFCIGNHDIYGWKQRHKPGVAEDPSFGKVLALQHLKLASRYYSFDAGGWHFVVLDSTHAGEGNHAYIARLDEEQFTWLARDLAATPPATPVCVLSHIPILSAAVFFDGQLTRGTDWVVPAAWMHIDAQRIKDLFKRHANVKLCLSGHLHLIDDLSYLGVRYLCNGAVCGGWWKGPYQEFGPVYSLLDFFEDGSVQHQPVRYSS
jgi:3',5'-cyclic AMP phosphodiesterase CpdA